MSTEPRQLTQFKNRKPLFQNQQNEYYQSVIKCLQEKPKPYDFRDRLKFLPKKFQWNGPDRLSFMMGEVKSWKI